MKNPSHFASVVLAALTVPAFALTVPVAQDTSSTVLGKLSATSGKATSLSVNLKQTALVRFDLTDLDVVPPQFLPGNITSATLRLYVVGAKSAGPITIHAVTTNWQENVAVAPVDLPTIDPTVLATIDAADLVAKRCVTVDITPAVVAALNSGNIFGFALQTTDPAAKIRLGSKEGTGIGEAPTLDIEANLSAGAAGAVSVSGNFSVSNDFFVEAHPNSTGGLNNFIGMNAGHANTTGLGNTFIGHNAGKANIGGSSNSFFGLNAGSSNTTGDLNVFLGQGAGAFNDSGSNNNFVGQAAGFNSLSGNNNNFFGWKAGFATSTGNDNAFFGDEAGAANNASNNSFFGSGAGATNSSGTQDCYFGINAGNKTTGSFNSFFGAGAGQFTTTGFDDTFMGNIAGLNNTTGQHNTFIGGNTGGAITTESNNTFLGAGANGAAGNTNSTAIGANASVTASNSLVLGSISGVNGAAADTRVGIGTTAPNSTLQVNGSMSVAVRTAAAAILIGLTSDDFVLVVTGTGTSSVGLPSPVAGRVYIIKNRATGTITLGPTTGSATIDGNATITIGANTGVAEVVSDGTNWYKIN